MMEISCMHEQCPTHYTTAKSEHLLGLTQNRGAKCLRFLHKNKNFLFGFYCARITLFDFVRCPENNCSCNLQSTWYWRWSFTFLFANFIIFLIYSPSHWPWRRIILWRNGVRANEAAKTFDQKPPSYLFTSGICF